VVFDGAVGLTLAEMILTPTVNAVPQDIARVTSLFFEWV